jgi:hypothetical protein
LRDKINELATNSKNRNTRAQHRRGNQPRNKCKLVKDENGDLLADSHNNVNRFLQEPHGITSQKTPFFIVTAVKTSNLTHYNLLL